MLFLSFPFLLKFLAQPSPYHTLSIPPFFSLFHIRHSNVNVSSSQLKTNHFLYSFKPLLHSTRNSSLLLLKQTFLSYVFLKQIQIVLPPWWLQCTCMKASLYLTVLCFQTTDILSWSLQVVSKCLRWPVFCTTIGNYWFQLCCGNTDIHRI